MSEFVLNRETEGTEATAHKIGERALWGGGVFAPELGVNDPLTHLEQYLEQGDTALASIDEDLITDIAERKLKPVFVNKVLFDRFGSDFISRENKFSMRRMTAITEDKFAKDETADLQLYKRAKIESKEVDRLDRWFDTAELNDVFIVESLPLGTERYTIVRGYQKLSSGQLAEHVITLHNATVATFSLLRRELGAEVPPSHTELELLDNMYSYRPTSDDFGSEYVAAYDKSLSQLRPGQEYNFGLPVGEGARMADDIHNVRRQTALRSVYHDTLKILRGSGGYVTSEVISKSQTMGCSYNLATGDRISFGIARELLDRSLQSIAATFDRASNEHLEALAASQDVSAAADYAGHYGGEARAAGVRYEGACPSSAGSQTAEAAALATGYRFNQDPSQCGTCPKCSKEYFVDEKVYNAKILECNNCHEAIRFGGGRVSKAELESLRGGEPIGFLDIIFESLAEFNRQYRAEQAEKKAVQLARQQSLAEELPKAA